MALVAILLSLALIVNHALMGPTPLQVDELRRTADNQTIDQGRMLDELLTHSVILVAEEHDHPGHHQVQLAVVQGLWQRGKHPMVALEMLPASMQPVLDRYLAGTIDETAFLDESEWYFTWSFDPELYLPIFRFALDKKIPLLAVNVDRQFVNRVRREGLDSLAKDPPYPTPPMARTPPAHWEWLKEIFDQHPMFARMTRLENFVDAKRLWDAAMAKGILDNLKRRPERPLVMLTGGGHALHGHGIAHQLRHQGGPQAALVIPWNVVENGWPERGAGDYLWGVGEKPESPPPVKIGVQVKKDDGAGVLVEEVQPDSPAMHHLQAGDRVVAVDHVPIVSQHALVRLIRAKKWGDSLDLTLLRGEKRLTLSLPLVLPSADH